MTKRQATLIADLGFGDAGKGTIVDFLARQRTTPTIVRFNGGAQAAHNVITPEGVHHTFSQFGSGSFVPGVRTHLSRFMLIDPPALVREADNLRQLGCGQVMSRLTVDRDALVVTPFMKAANRLREVLRGDGRHGSCGMGIGETTSYSLNFPDDAIRAGDLRDRTTLIRKLQRLQEVKRGEFQERFAELAGNSLVTSDIALLNDPGAPITWAEQLASLATFPIVPGDYLRRLADRSDLIFEGAQGVLIDQWYGFHPYTTWSVTTFDNALRLLSEINYQWPIAKLGILRAYYTRHGPGPFPTEDRQLTADLPDRENIAGRWQGAFRVGWFDQVLAKYAIAACGGIDALALTHLDRYTTIKNPQICPAYETGGNLITALSLKPVLTDQVYQESVTQLLSTVKPIYQSAPSNEIEYQQSLEEALKVPITITSHGPRATDKKFTDAPAMSS